MKKPCQRSHSKGLDRKRQYRFNITYSIDWQSLCTSCARSVLSVQAKTYQALANLAHFHISTHAATQIFNLPAGQHIFKLAHFHPDSYRDKLNLFSLYFFKNASNCSNV
jgi:hypothetical protein